VCGGVVDRVAGQAERAAAGVHPYQMVKDLRTEYEVGNPQTVLDGEIDDFLEAATRWRRQQQTPE
jgi:peptide chain release factor 2